MPFQNKVILFSKFVIKNITIEVEIQVLFKGLLLAKALRFSNLRIQDDFLIEIWLVSITERGLLKCNEYIYRILIFE